MARDGTRSAVTGRTNRKQTGVAAIRFMSEENFIAMAVRKPREQDRDRRIREAAECHRLLEQTCRARLGRTRGVSDARERYEHLSALIDALAPTIDRAAVYEIVAHALAIYGSHTITSPAWCGDRDAAVLNIGRTIDKLRRVLLGTGLESADGPLAPITQAYEELRAHPFLTAHPKHRAVPTKAGGKPASTWVHYAEDKLKTMGISRRVIREILSAVHLTADLTRPLRRETPSTI